MKFFLLIVNLIIIFKVFQVTHLFSFNRQMVDFDNYYRTVQDIKKGINPYTISYMQSLGPPITYLYYYPYSLFNKTTAQFIFLIVNIICGYTTCIVLSKKHFLWLSIILFLSFLSRYSLQIGQPILTIGLFISLVITKNKWTSIALAGLIFIKSFFAFTLISAKTYLPLLLILIGLIAMPLGWTKYYLQNKLWQNVGSFTNATQISYENQSLLSTLSRNQIAVAYPYIWIAIFIIGGYMSLKRKDPLLGILFSFLLTPVLWQHYLAALFPIFVIVLRKKLTLLALISFILWWINLKIPYNSSITTLAALSASHFYISLVLLTASVVLFPSPNPVSDSDKPSPRYT
jgi:hypothetical protein